MIDLKGKRRRREDVLTCYTKSDGQFATKGLLFNFARILGVINEILCIKDKRNKRKITLLKLIALSS